MPVVDVVNLEGKRVGEVELADAVFAARVNPHLLHEAVRWYLSGQRRGTHKTKGRGEVAGSGRKLWRQKGTGRARVGSIRSPLWYKGGTVHGPQPRSYAYALPRKMRQGALRSALSAKLAAEQLTVVEGLQLDSHKTKAFRQALDRLGADSTALLVDQTAGRNLALASRNLEGVKLVMPRELETYDVLRHDRVLLTREAALKLSAALGGGNGAAAAPAPQADPAPPPRKTARPRAARPAAKPRTRKGKD